jgi:hypothetical protein
MENFLILWFVSVIVSLVASRMIIKITLKEDYKAFDNETGMFIFMVLSPLIPIFNIISIIFVAIVTMCMYFNDIGLSKVLQRIYFIRLEDKDEKTKKSDKKNS